METSPTWTRTVCGSGDGAHPPNPKQTIEPMIPHVIQGLRAPAQMLLLRVAPVTDSRREWVPVTCDTPEESMSVSKAGVHGKKDEGFGLGCSQYVDIDSRHTETELREDDVPQVRTLIGNLHGGYEFLAG